MNVSADRSSEIGDSHLHAYFKQCSIMATPTDLAVIGATIANLGVHPVTGEHVFDIDAVRDTQSVMFSCGMYDYSGGWTYEVGIPAKSGSGAEFSVLSIASWASARIRRASTAMATRFEASQHSR